MSAINATGVIIEQGPQNWQVIQQDRRGMGTIRLAGRWLTAEPHTQVRVIVRLVEEATHQPVTRALEWAVADTGEEGTWTATLAGVPAGGLYRLETALQLNGGPVEWARRGDMRHHLGVGDLWVIAGQSNAAGYGKTPCEDPVELGVHMFHACGAWQLATHPLSDSTDTRYPANREGANGSQSPFLAFGRRLKRALGHPIGLIPAALGGSPISRWVRGVDGDLFENMLAYIRDAGGTCRGMVWYQGESDVGPDQRGVYAARFKAMVRDVRSCLQAPRLPVITAQLNRYIGEPYDRACHGDWEAMRELQRQLARTVRGVEIVSTLDLALSDAIHNDSKANLTIGERMADTALGAVYGRDIKFRCPDLAAAIQVEPDAIDLEFDHVDTRLNFEHNIPEHFPFAVRDRAGTVPVRRWRLHGGNRIRIDLARRLEGAATVTGAPTACPPVIVPLDICGYRPMLAFTARVRAQR